MSVIITHKYDIIIKLPFVKNKVFLFIIMCLSFISNPLLSQQVDVTDSTKESSHNNLTKIKSNDTILGLQYENFYSDSLTSKKIKTNPRRAALYSAILPGLGQTYNGNYWKVPIIYTCFIGMYFLGAENNFRYHTYKDAVIIKESKDTKDDLKLPENLQDAPLDQLISRKDLYKRNRDFNIIIGLVFYLANILDANVDAHLMDYDINPDLSLKIKPEINNFFVDQKYSNKSSFGIKFVLSMH